MDKYQIISLSISVIALVLSCVSYIRVWKSERMKIEISVDQTASIDLTHAALSMNIFDIACVFVNKSRLAVAIKKIVLKDSNGNEYCCTLKDAQTYEYLNPKNYGPTRRSILFPINLHPLQGTSGVLQFIIPPPYKNFRITNAYIYTNKKK